MVLPTSPSAALLLLVVAFLGLWFWPESFRFATARRRYEFFALDSALGALALSLGAAYTLGTLGPEATFQDRLLIAGRSSAVWPLTVGLLFALSNLLLLLGATLLGSSSSFLWGASLALAATAASWMGGSNWTLLAASIALALSGAFCAFRSAQTIAASQNRLSPSRFLRGAVGTCIGGLALGICPLLLAQVSDPEYGAGPYALTLLVAGASLFSTLLFDLFAVHVGVVGKPVGITGYFRIPPKDHLLGWAAGIASAAALLSILLAVYAEGDSAPSARLMLIIPGTAVFLFSLLKLPGRNQPALRKWLGMASALFAAALVAGGLGLGRG